MSHSRLKQNFEPRDRFDEVVSVASRLIAKDGFEKASIRNIAQKADLSQAGLYHYFQSKEFLLYQIQKHSFTALRNSLAARLDASLSPTERLKLLIRNHLEFFIAHMDELRVCTFEHAKLSGNYHEEVLAIRKDYFRIANSIVAEVLAERKDQDRRRLNSKRITLYIFGALNWIHMWFDTERRTDIDELVEELSEMVLCGITARKG